MASDNIYGYIASVGPDGYVSPMSNLYYEISRNFINTTLWYHPSNIRTEYDYYN